MGGRERGRASGRERAGEREGYADEFTSPCRIHSTIREGLIQRKAVRRLMTRAERMRYTYSHIYKERVRYFLDFSLA